MHAFVTLFIYICCHPEENSDSKDKYIAVSVPLAFVSVTISVVAIVLGSCWYYHKKHHKRGPGQSVINHTGSEEGKAIVLSDTLLKATKNGKLTIILETDKVCSHGTVYMHLIILLMLIQCTYTA